MKLAAAFFLLAALQANAQSDSTHLLVADGAKPVLVSKQFKFTEGPAPDRKGNIYFTDQPNNTIWKYDTKGKLSLFTDQSGRSNGLYVDKKGNILACADADNQLWSFSPKGKHTVLVDNFEGKKLNGPNDLWIHPNGDIYFTDPYYQRNYWTRQKPEIEGMKVYCLPAGAKAPVVVADDIVKPNGIVGTPDGKYLYVADIGGDKIYRYDILPNNQLGNRMLFTNKGGDGITLDERGNLYLCGNGVFIYNPQGQQIGHIDVPEKWTANACFGGKKRNILFLTASTAIYTVAMKVKGAE